MLNKEFLLRLSVALFLLPLSLVITSMIFESHLDTEVLEPLNEAYKTTDVVLARNNIKEALKATEKNQQVYFLTPIPPNNHKVQSWEREIKKYREQLAYFQENKPKPIESVPSMPKEVNWLYLSLLSFLFVPVTTSTFLLFELELDFEKINFKKINFHFRPKSRKELFTPPLFEVSLKDPTLEPSKRICFLILELIFYPLERLVSCFIPSYIDRFNHLPEHQREELKDLFERKFRDERIWKSYEKLEGLSHFERIKILTFTNQIEIIDGRSSLDWLQEGDILVESNRFCKQEELIAFCQLNGFNYLGEGERKYHQMRTVTNKRIFWKIDSFTESVAQRGTYIYTQTYLNYLEDLSQKAKIYQFCAECIYHVGRTDGDNYLHCSVHPYGLDEPNCPDKTLPK